MATLTLTPKSVDSQLPPVDAITFSSSAIPVQNFDAANYPVGIVSKRPYPTRALNIFDFTTNIYPPTPETFDISNIKGVLITGLGYYNSSNIEVPVTSFSYVKRPVSVNPLLVNDYVPKEDLGWAVTPLLGIFVETWETTMHDCIYIKFKHRYNDDTHGSEGVLKLYRGSSSVVYLKFTEICNIKVIPDTLNVLKMEDIQNLNNTKNLDINTILNVTSPRLPDLFPEVLTEGTKFISRIYFMNSFFSDDFSVMNKVTSDDRLTYAGVPVYEGQGIPINGINNGLLKFDATGLTPTQLINNYTFYVLYEGFASGDAFIKSI